MRSVAVFFYGSYMNRKVLAEVGLAPALWDVATLAGWELVIGPRANLQPSPGSMVWGIVAAATHAELARLYTDHALAVLGETYLPEAVVVSDGEARMRPALTYVCPDMQPRPADPAYVERIAAPAEAAGFPSEYVRHIRSFAPR